MVNTVCLGSTIPTIPEMRGKISSGIDRQGSILHTYQQSSCMDCSPAMIPYGIIRRLEAKFGKPPVYKTGHAPSILHFRHHEKSLYLRNGIKHPRQYHLAFDHAGSNPPSVFESSNRSFISKAYEKLGLRNKSYKGGIWTIFAPRRPGRNVRSCSGLNAALSQFQSAECYVPCRRCGCIIYSLGSPHKGSTSGTLTLNVHLSPIVPLS